jgi:hypothetical protein
VLATRRATTIASIVFAFQSVWILKLSPYPVARKMMRWRIMSVLHLEQSIFKLNEEMHRIRATAPIGMRSSPLWCVAAPDDEVQNVMLVGDLPGATISPADQMLMKVNGDYIHSSK